MLPKDYSLNLKRSFFKYLRERLSIDYYLNYSSPSDEELQKRIQEKSDPNWWRWIEVNWLRVGPGIYSISTLQLNCNTAISEDRFGRKLTEMADELQEELNVDTIPLLDFSTDPDNPVATDNVLIPRFRGARSLPNAAGDTVGVMALDYNLYVFRESVLP